ncbi:putative N-alkane-inducible cytochrome P450 [Xylariaceae sp. FL0662B]|nr:putative N-alkane-inducible cytochrome P450 [Xylariaceae sp. FL0662B]
MLGYTSTGFLLLALLLAWTIVKSKLKRRRNNAKAASLGCQAPPSLRSTNLLGNSVLRESMRATREDRGPQYVVEAMDRVGPSCHTLRVPIVDYEILVTRDPANAHALLTSPDFDISSTRQRSWMPLLGRGIFTSRGDAWRHSRALLRPQFARDMLGDPLLEESHLGRLFGRLAADPATGWTDKVDLAPLFFEFTLDTTTEFIFGRSTDSLLRLRENDAGMSAHFDAAKVWIDKRGALAKFYWLMNSRAFKEHCAAIHAFADDIVAERLARPRGNDDGEKSHNNSGGSDANDLEKARPTTGRYNLLDELAKETQDPRELRNELLHVLIAGRDTTGCLLGWTMYFLARHPGAYARLRAAVLERFGGDEEQRRPDFRALGQVAYLQWVISEALRVATVIPLNERVALRDTVLPRGGGADGQAKVFVPKGTQVLLPLYAMQHREDIWGADVEEFRPERWETHRAGWEFVPFGAGARKCLGQQFGRQEVSYVIARFCQKYDRIENMEEGDGRIRLHHAIENRSGTGVQVRLHEAKASATAKTG